MKNIITTHITDSARLPLMARTLNWINLGIKETVANSVYAQLDSNDDSVPIVLWGCIPTYSTVTTANDTLHLTAGAIIQGGEVFYLGDTTVTKTGTDVFVIQDYYVNQTSEPTKYTDSTLYPTNVDHQLNLVAGATGSGLCDFNDLKYLNYTLADTSIDASGSIIKNYGSSSGYTLYYTSVNLKKRGDMVFLDGFLRIFTTSTIPTIQFNLSNVFARSTNNQLATGNATYTLYNDTDDELSPGFIDNYGTTISFIRPTTFIAGKNYVLLFQISFKVD